MITRTADHRYRLDDGPFVPGATGVIRVMDKGWGFENWMKREVAKSAVGRLEFLTNLINEGGEEAAIAWLTKLPDFQRDKAADVGSQVHDLADQMSKEQKPTVPTELVPFVQGELRFLRDHKPTRRKSEIMGYSDKGYGATLDEISVIGGQLSLIERKTGKNVYEDAVRMQLAAQANVDVLQVGSRVIARPLIARTYVLHLRPDAYADGYRLIEYHLTDADFDAFLACLRLTTWRAQLNGKG